MADHASDDLADRVRDLRARRLWTQADLALQVGTTPQTVSRWEQGSPPQAGLRRRLEALLRDDGPAAPSPQVIQFPVHAVAPLHVAADPDTSADDLRATVVRAAAARLASGAAFSDGELALLRTLFATVDIEWDPGDAS